jgi:hypothetical protein
MKKFEYLMEWMRPADAKPWGEQLNDLGLKGWELVSTLVDEGDVAFIFKREVA